ncbi:hypothetical protein DRE_07342 [Drechslerella stenobrocha 248]|uniref:Uncharacterized protein n=1 Tax=Drechslerella stenobrocha 248 TaxID=1043628 RepID=W7HUR1_9PEZI|nr:hypothetical protein DRE_07342 [Drechslerella stenobrocha 248]
MSAVDAPRRYEASASVTPAITPSVTSGGFWSAPGAIQQTSPSKLLHLFDPSMYYPVFANLIAILGFDDIARLSFTCRALSSLPRQVVSLECNVDRMLKSWFSNPKRTRSVMAEQNAIVGSHFATSLFSRQYETGTIRFYVTQGPQADALAAYFESEGYEEARRQDSSAESRRKKFIKPGCPWALVEMRLCSTSPIGAFLAAVNTTHLLNLVTSHKAYCLFPISSFVYKMSFITRDLTNDSVQNAICRYSSYGYDFQPIIWNTTLLPYSHEITSPRRFGDKLTWMIEFDNTGIPPPVAPLSVVESTCFRLSVTPDPNLFANRQQNYATSRYRLSCSSFKSCVLKHVYTFGCSAWRAYIGARVDALTRIELCKLPVKDRLHLDMNTKKDFYQLEGSFQRHAHWKYYDHIVREWWEEWTKENAAPGRS